MPQCASIQVCLTRCRSRKESCPTIRRCPCEYSRRRPTLQWSRPLARIRSPRPLTGSLGNPKGHRVVGDSRSNRSFAVPDVANFGLARPPLIYLGSIVLGLVIHIVWPARLVPPAISTPVG